MRVCQLAFEQMSSKALVPYSKKSAKYQGQNFAARKLIAQDPEFKNRFRYWEHHNHGRIRSMVITLPRRSELEDIER